MVRRGSNSKKNRDHNGVQDLRSSAWKLLPRRIHFGCRDNVPDWKLLHGRSFAALFLLCQSRILLSCRIFLVRGNSLSCWVSLSGWFRRQAGVHCWYVLGRKWSQELLNVPVLRGYWVIFTVRFKFLRVVSSWYFLDILRRMCTVCGWQVLGREWDHELLNVHLLRQGNLLCHPWCNLRVGLPKL